MGPLLSDSGGPQWNPGPQLLKAGVGAASAGRLPSCSPLKEPADGGTWPAAPLGACRFAAGLVACTEAACWDVLLALLELDLERCRLKGVPAVPSRTAGVQGSDACRQPHLLLLCRSREAVVLFRASGRTVHGDTRFHVAHRRPVTPAFSPANSDGGATRIDLGTLCQAGDRELCAGMRQER